MGVATLKAWHACMMYLVALGFSCCPSMAQIVLYQHYNFRGKSKSLSSSSTSLIGFHDTASSIKVQSGTWRVYQHSNYKGTSKVYGPGDYPKISPNDQASSVKLESGGPSDPDDADDAAAKWKFGDHVEDQCTDPIQDLEVTNFRSDDALRIPPKKDGVCNSPLGYCLGDCVRVHMTGGDSLGDSPVVNVIAGQTLPDPKDCDPRAKGTNWPKKQWDFSATGWCGQGRSVIPGVWEGEGFWNGCLVHDVCVWARCTDPNLVAGGDEFLPDFIPSWVLEPFGYPQQSAADDYACGGPVSAAAKDDFTNGNLATQVCVSDNQCPEYFDCVVGKCRIEGRPEGYACATDSDCKDYCELGFCQDGSSGDPCNKDSECQGALTCQGLQGLGATCTAKKPEGAGCGSDADCVGYCEIAQCWDGSHGDRCGDSGDCQGSLSCKRRQRCWKGWLGNTHCVPADAFRTCR